MSDVRFPSKGPPPGSKKEVESDGGNALWRIPQWFPHLDGRVQEALRDYHSELLKFNARLNLISRNTERDADEVHFADCLLAAEIVGKCDFGSPVYDIGSGNGLPGVVLAILNPGREFVLVESDSRKAEFLKHLVHTLELSHVQVMNMRLESLQAAQIKACVSRGLASISKTCLMFNRIFPVGGQFFHFKGAGWSSEIAEIPSQLIAVWKPELMGEYALPVSQARRAVVCTTKKQ